METSRVGAFGRSVAVGPGWGVAGISWVSPGFGRYMGAALKGVEVGVTGAVQLEAISAHRLRTKIGCRRWVTETSGSRKVDLLGSFEVYHASRPAPSLPYTSASTKFNRPASSTIMNAAARVQYPPWAIMRHATIATPIMIQLRRSSSFLMFPNR